MICLKNQRSVWLEYNTDQTWWWSTWGAREKHRLYFYFIYLSIHLPAGLYMCCAVLCLITQSCPTLCNPMTVARQAPLSMGFSRQEYWSGLPCPPPGNLPNLGIEPRSPTLLADSLPSEPPGKGSIYICLCNIYSYTIDLYYPNRNMHILYPKYTTCNFKFKIYFYYYKDNTISLGKN